MALDFTPDSVEMARNSQVNFTDPLRLLRPRRNKAKVFMQHFDETVLSWRWPIRRVLLNRSAGEGAAARSEDWGEFTIDQPISRRSSSKHLYVNAIAPLSEGR